MDVSGVYLSLFVALFGLVSYSNGAFCGPDCRLAVVKLIESPNGNTLMFFKAEKGTKSLFWKTQAELTSASGIQRNNDWHSVNVPFAVISNVAAATMTSKSAKVFAQATDGQIYSSTMTRTSPPSFGAWACISQTAKLPYDSNVPEWNGRDSVHATMYSGAMYVFARSHSNSSRLYYSYSKDGTAFSKFSTLGGTSAILKTDATIKLNPFTKLMEAYAIMTDGHLYRSWQLSFSKWSSWDKTGYFAPTSNHPPAAHQLENNFFNGRLEVFVYGTDGYVHHIWQTTCDKVPNPWGWCTWSLWNKIDSKVPKGDTNGKVITAGSNLHLGLELFTIDTAGKLYQLWQLDYGSKWNPWRQIGGEYAFASTPTIVDNDGLWWTAYGLDHSGSLLAVQEKRKIQLSSTKVPYGTPVQVSWSVPVDEATAQDWVGVFPHGMNNKFYVDYYYVGGSHNPKSKPIPVGSLNFTSYLPQGEYDYRYMINKRYVSAMGTSLQVTSSSADKEWLQVFRGIFSGLGLSHVDVEHCVNDTTQIVENFKKSFAEFENVQIYDGLHDLGFALTDVYKALQDCHVTEMVEGIEKFVQDLVNCIEGSCIHFTIDVVDEILILFKNIYEIYGEIQGASNSFKIKAYQQGGLSVGRVIKGCVSMEK